MIRASPLYYDAFLSARDELLTQAILRELASKGVNIWPLELCNTSDFGPQSVQIAWVECLLKPGMVLDEDTGPQLHSAFVTFYSHEQCNQKLTFSARHVKALRWLENILVWMACKPHWLRDASISDPRERPFHVFAPGRSLRISFCPFHDCPLVSEFSCNITLIRERNC